MDAGDILGIVLFALAAGVAIAIALWIGEQRRKALAAVAASLGLAFHPSRVRAFHREHPHDLFKRGSGRAASNLLTGTIPVGAATFAVIMGDYQYTTGAGKHRTTHRLSFLLLRPPWTRLPDLAIRGEHLGDKLMGALGFDDIDFESEEFSRAFHVTSSDKRTAYAVVHPRMMEFLLARSGPTVEIVAGECLVRQGGRWSPQEFPRLLEWATAFFRHWPAHLTRELA